MLKALFCSICIFLLTLFSINRIYGSDYFEYALKILSEGKFFEASIEFERTIYYENDSSHKAQYKYYKSLCYKGLKRYDKALEELNSIKMEFLPDSLFLPFRYEQILCSYLNNDLNQALHNIDEINLRYKDTLSIVELIPLEILCLNACRQWGNALILWDFYIDNLQIQESLKNDFKNEINKLYDKKNIPGFHSPVKAKKLSSFLPGSGQIYSGAVFEGSISFLINAALLYYTFTEFYNKNYITGYFIGLGFFEKFYKGGRYRANLLAQNRNEEEIKKFNAEISSLIIKILNANHSTSSFLLH
jgi:hypothetical protein